MNKSAFFLRWSNGIKVLFVVISALLVLLFLFLSNGLVEDLSKEERNKIETWAKATSLLVNSTEMDEQTVDLISHIIESNTTIPVLLCDSLNRIISHNNIELPVNGSDVFLNQKLNNLKDKRKPIVIEIDQDIRQYLYYDDSILLKRLSYYPYLQLSVMFVFILLLLWAFKILKRSEQNRVWAGLSKETAHQLGTPISSIMAWIEILKSEPIDPTITTEISKDTDRLTMIAERFSKIGSEPEIRQEEITKLIKHSVDYMSRRVSNKVLFTINNEFEPIIINVSAPLIEWVVENLSKNAVDAMSGNGMINIQLHISSDKLLIDIADTGKGIPKKHHKTIFEPGFTTKSRGWGLGLTLVKRIIHDYHKGKVYVLTSEIGLGTTFRIELPLTDKKR